MGNFTISTQKQFWNTPEYLTITLDNSDTEVYSSLSAAQIDGDYVVVRKI